MRISFRTKLFAVLVVTLALLIGGALYSVHRISGAQIDELIRVRGEQGQQAFRKLVQRRQSELVGSCRDVARSTRFQTLFRDEREPEKRGGEAMYELSALRQISFDLLTLTDLEGVPFVRYLCRCGSRTAAGGRGDLEWRCNRGGDAPELRLARQVLAGAPPELVDPFLIIEGRIFLVVAVPVRDLDEEVGTVILGYEIDDWAAGDIHEYQPVEDQVAYAVGTDLAATSFGPEARVAVAEAFRGPLPARAGDPPFVRDMQIGAEPYRAVISAVHAAEEARPIYSAVFLSLRSLRAFRDQARAITFAVAVIALGVAVLTSIRFAQQVSAPVRELVQGTRRIARGEYSTRILASSRDELGELADSFNHMAADLSTKEKVRAVLHKVVSKEVAEELLRSDLGLSGRLVRATLVFADLRGFTAMTRGMPPSAVVAMLNEYMTAMSEEILACRGIVDKYVGDEIIGVFGAPRSYGNDAVSAVRSAVRMRARLEKVNEARAARGEPSLAMGIGIHTGDVVAGCMGSPDLLSYTCIGEAVNLASRLCGSARGGQVMISDETRRAVGETVVARPLDAILVKGFPDPVPVHEVVEMRPADAPVAS